MIVRRFLLWARTASVTDRAAGVRVLAEAYCRSPMTDDDRRDAETAMLAMLGDPSAMVRRALAEGLAAEQAPRAVILGLVQDQSDIAAIVLAASPMLCEADLVDAAAVGDERMQAMIARRADIQPPLAAALVEVACPAAVAALLGNSMAEIAEATLQRAADRLGADPEVREALLARADLALCIRHQLALQVAASLSDWVGVRGLMSKERTERVTRESSEKVAVRLAARTFAHGGDGHGGAMEAELSGLIEQLRRSNRLTPALILRSLLSGETALAEAALAHLAGVPLARAADILHDRRGGGVAALCRKAQLPAALIPAFVAAVAALREIGAPATDASRASISRRITERVLIACDSSDDVENASLMALLRRFEADAAREEAFDIAQGLADDAALSALREVDPGLTMLEGTFEEHALAA